MDEPFWRTNLILKVIAGDHAYGLDTAGQTPEIRAVCIPPRQERPARDDPEPWAYYDEQGHILTYTLSTFVQRALDCDPAMIELLYAAPRHVLFADAYGQRLLDHRELFLSMRARHTFASAALRRLERVEQRRHHDLPAGAPAQGKFSGEPARAGLAQQYGYDTVDAMHAIRLLAMGSEILETSQVHVYRHDRKWLRSVREGTLTYDELRDLVPVCLARHDRLSRLSSLPEQPDVPAVEALALELQEGYRSEKE